MAPSRATYGLLCVCRLQFTLLVPLRNWTLRVATPISNTDHQFSPFQKDDMLVPQWVGSLQSLMTMWSMSDFRMEIAPGYSGIVLGLSHLPLPRAF